jgi:hypothetical protein
MQYLSNSFQSIAFLRARADRQPSTTPFIVFFRNILLPSKPPSSELSGNLVYFERSVLFEPKFDEQMRLPQRCAGQFPGRCRLMDQSGSHRGTLPSGLLTMISCRAYCF